MDISDPSPRFLLPASHCSTVRLRHNSGLITLVAGTKRKKEIKEKHSAQSVATAAFHTLSEENFPADSSTQQFPLYLRDVNLLGCLYLAECCDEGETTRDGCMFVFAADV